MAFQLLFVRPILFAEFVREQLHRRFRTEVFSLSQDGPNPTRGSPSQSTRRPFYRYHSAQDLE